VHRLLAIAESVERLRPLLQDESGRAETRRRLAREIERIGEIVGL
jgi:hypothetical protein